MLDTPDLSSPTVTPATTTTVQAEHTATGSLAPGYFDRLYAAHGDPWSFASSPYEAGKYAATLAELPRLRYRSGLEVGCAIGVLTARLSAHCDRLLALDVSESALRRARARCAGLAVRFQQRTLPDETPSGPFDLVMLSEVGYYWSAADLGDAQARLAAAAVPGAHLVLVHYTGETNYPLTGDAVHDAFLSDPAWSPLRTRCEASYRLDVLERVAG